jgi:SAM-dependent methyltransferase
VAIPCPPAKPAGTAETALKPTGTDKQGVAFTNLGPAAYTGDILEDPELLWTEDVWSEEREEEARSKLSQQGDAVPAYWKTQYESKAGSYWHKFYKRNADHFYKDRHYLHIVFPELLHGAAPPTGDGTAPPAVVESNPQYLLEVGCGVGNAVLPLVELNSNLHIVAMDFAASAIEILNRHPFVHSCVDALPSKCLDVTALGDRYLRRNSVSAASSSSGSSSGSSGGDAAVSPENANRRVRTAVRCIVKDPLPVPSASMDLALCMFVLSAISPAEQLVALGKIAAVLKPGGKLLVRDYGR